MSTQSQKKVFAQQMLIFCQAQEMLWKQIEELCKSSNVSTDSLLTKEMIKALEDLTVTVKPEIPRAVIPPRVPRPAIDWRERIGHVSQIILILLIINAGRPLMIAGAVYAVLILIGVPFAAIFRANQQRLGLEAVLGRLKLRLKAKKRLETFIEKIKKGETLNEQESEQVKTDELFLHSIKPKKHKFIRALYQGPLMFLLTILPNAQPDPEMLT